MADDVTFTSTLQCSILSMLQLKKKKNRFRKLSNLPMVRQLGSGWAGIRGTQECLIPRQAHVLSPGLTCLYSYSNKDFGKLLKEV